MNFKLFIISVLIIAAAGCAGGKPSTITEYYMLDYGPPVLEDVTPFDENLRIERFSVAQIFNSNTIVFRTGEFSLAAYPYNRWRANPGDMITDYLVRDFRHGGLFRAVFSYRYPEKTRFILEGSVVEFLEIRQEGSRKASLGINITLLDMNQKEIPPKVVFQKNYSHSAICKEEGSRGLAQGLSKSMEELSRQISNDVYHAINKARSR